MRELEKKLKAIANLRRLVILKFLRKRGEAHVYDIAEHLNLSFRATSRHLRILFTTGILEKEQRGIYVHYRMAGDLLPEIKAVIAIA